MMSDVQPTRFENSTPFYNTVFIPVTVEGFRDEYEEIEIKSAKVGGKIPLTPEQIQAIHQDVCDELAGF